MNAVPIMLNILEGESSDTDAIVSLYPNAFPDEDLVPLVRELIGDPAIAASLVGVVNSQIVGHGIFTRCCLIDNPAEVRLLGPLVVAPEWQKLGIGSAIVRAGLERLRNMGVCLVCVLGDPAYYKRFGFVPESLVQPPYPLRTEWIGAWQSLRLCDETVSCSGRLSVPQQWRQPALWM